MIARNDVQKVQQALRGYKQYDLCPHDSDMSYIPTDYMVPAIPTHEQTVDACVDFSLAIRIEDVEANHRAIFEAGIIPESVTAHEYEIHLGGLGSCLWKWKNRQYHPVTGVCYLCR